MTALLSFRSSCLCFFSFSLPLPPPPFSINRVPFIFARIKIALAARRILANHCDVDCSKLGDSGRFCRKGKYFAVVRGCVSLERPLSQNVFSAMTTREALLKDFHALQARGVRNRTSVCESRSERRRRGDLEEQRMQV